VEQHWIDAADRRVHEDSDLPRRWWTVFHDEKLNNLVLSASRQNLTLRQAGFRILEARAQLGIVQGNLFPQQQDVAGGYRRLGVGNSFFSQWNWGFNLGWELDFWGRFRRAVAAADANLDASIFDYDDVLVTLLGDVATEYVIIRADQERIRLLEANIAIQRAVLDVAEQKLKAGAKGLTSVDVEQVRGNLLQNEASIEQLLVDLRHAENRLCILLGMPPHNIAEELGDGPIPVATPDVAVGMPADLLCRRPDVRRAERLAAAQAEEIGIAEADFYPAISINGTLGYQARQFSELFSSNALNSSFGPSFRWNVLNYGRLVNNVRFQEARLQELIVAYQSTVLSASEEVENGIVSFLRAQRRAKLLEQSANSSTAALKVMRRQLDVGAIDFNQYATIQQNLIQQQDLWAQARAEIARGLIQTYRALGGGWEIRFPNSGAGPAVAPEAPPAGETIPAPAVPEPPVPPEPPRPEAIPAPPATKLR
jgi:NodT family efflux transporter outer membrane factor (OMF) lipoprotein